MRKIKSRRWSCLLFGLLFAVSIPGLAAHSPHTFTGTLSVSGRAFFIQDSDATADPVARGTWVHRGEGDFLGIHGFHDERVLLNYRLRFRQSQFNPTIIVGDAGQGVVNSSAIALGIDVYEAAFHHEANYTSVMAGRHFAPRRFQQRRDQQLMMLTFPVTDTIHAREINRENTSGIDGFSLSFDYPTAVTLRSSVSFSEVYRRDGDFQYLRVANEISYMNIAGLTLGWQPETYLRPGVYVQFNEAFGQILLEGAIEWYDPRQLQLAQDYLMGIRYQTPQLTWGTSSAVQLATEYHYNGLARTYPAIQGLLFQGDNRVTLDGAGGFLQPGFHYAHSEATFSGSQWELRNGIVFNLTDNSYQSNHELIVNPREGPYLFRTGVWWNYGEITTEFGRPSNSAAVYTTLSATF
jgi:hypothetical protein